MPLFQYKAATASGEVVEGQMEAATRDAVVRRLQADGHVPLRAEEVSDRPQPGKRRRLFVLRRQVSTSEVELSTVELATLLQAGLSVDRALEMLTKLAPEGPLRVLFDTLNREVRGGADLSAAMARHERLFSPFYLNMVRAGEASGALELALARLAEFLERSRQLRETLVSALVYPVILLVLAILSLALILGVVVPKISAMFTQAGESLPLATQVVVAIGEFVHGYGWVLALAAGLAWVLARRALDDPATRLRWDGFMLRSRLLGGFVAKHEAARFTRTLGTLLNSSVPLLESLAIARESVSNQAVRAALGRVSSSVREGEGLSRPLLEADVFPRLAANLVEVGEQTGSLDRMLLRLADIYDGEVQITLRRLVDLIGPLMILGLGLLIGGIIMSVLAAILSVNDLAF